ncbi:hypothetical protein FHW83_001489 [Duganella sp. SG902]|uniref:hypothetical protein n=1 Tax=Duganella sp. SG902 TaxID=2587016 RepID=UPI00159E7AB8|nr:hypothetical protein [Duganella sp. SG902]NVM75702.1 hypothetical protein [Duganella sp. SG902]
MKSTMTLQVDTDLLLQLISHLKIRGGAQDVSEAVNSAIVLWLREQSQLAKNCDPASVRGYQWKSLFLPEGTEIRSWSYGEHNYARVVGDEIIHKGKAVTPNQLAQSFARSMRNAWMDLSVRRPGDKQFKMAHRLRLELARQVTQPPVTAGGAEASLADTTVGALLSALQAQVRASQPAPSRPEPPAAPAAPRHVTPGEGWDLPERRKYRYRLEDVAFD